MINKILPSSFASIFTLTLVACGGGGGGSDKPQEPTYPIAQAYSQLLINGFATPYTIAFNSGPYAGDTSFNGTYTVTPLASASFEGQNVMANTTTMTLTATIGGVVSTLPSNVYQEFYDSNYNRKGYIGQPFGDYEVVNTINPLPTAAHVNDTGTWYTSTTYSGQSKAATLYTSTATYKIEADSASSVIFVVTLTYGSATSINHYRITDKGVAKLLSVHVISPDGPVPDYQLNLQ